MNIINCFRYLFIYFLHSTYRLLLCPVFALQLLATSASGFMLSWGRQLITMKGARCEFDQLKRNRVGLPIPFLPLGEKFHIVVLWHFSNSLAALALAYDCVSNKRKCYQETKERMTKHWTHAAAVWLIQVDSLWCVSIKAFTEAQRCGLPKAHQRPAYFISQVENVLRKRGRGNRGEVSESN